MDAELRILHIDQDHDEYFLINKRLLRTTLSFSLSWAPDWQDAEDHLSAQSFDVCLLDYYLDQKTGFRMLESIRQRDSHVAVVMLVSHRELGLDRKVIKLGADDMVSKFGLTAQLLERAVLQSIERRKIIEALQQSEQDYRHIAELSTSVLHNMGNLLNSLYTAGGKMRHINSESKLATLGKLNELISEHADELGGFLTEHPKGKLLPQMLTSLYDVLLEEQRQMALEIERHTDIVKLMEQTIRKQQDVAKEHAFHEPIHLDQIVDHAVAMCEPIVGKREIELRLEKTCAPFVEGSRSKLTQVLINLIKNAVEAMETTPRKRLHICLDEQDDTTATITISDTGCGIPKDKQPFLFQFGYSDKQEGHGFGLHYCHKTITAMGGSLTLVHSREHYGTTFAVRLPVLQRR